MTAVKISLRNKGERKTFSGKEKLRNCVTSKLDVKETPKKKKKKNPQMEATEMVNSYINETR